MSNLGSWCKIKNRCYAYEIVSSVVILNDLHTPLIAIISIYKKVSTKNASQHIACRDCGIADEVLSIQKK